MTRFLKDDFFFLDVGIGRDMLDVKSNELFIGTDSVDGSTSGTGTSGKATGIFFTPTTSVAGLVIGVVNLIVVIVFVIEKRRI